MWLSDYEKTHQKQDYLREKVISYIKPQIPIGSNIVHRFIVKYDTDTLSVHTVESTLIPAESFFNVSCELNRFGHVDIEGREYSKMEEMRPGYIDCHWLPGRFGFSDEQKLNLEATYREYDFSIYRNCLDAIYELK